jgi:protein-S-isoprenylcysteine O-methyltransferase Ste14
MQISQQTQKYLPRVSSLFRQIFLQPLLHPLPLRIDDAIKHRMADRAIRQDHVIAEHVLFHVAKTGLYFAQIKPNKEKKREMTDIALLLIAGLIFILFSIFSLWFLRREYRLRGKLTWFGSIVHVAMYAIHGMFSSLLVWGPSTVPALGTGGRVGIALMIIGFGITFYAMDLLRTFSRWVGNDTPGLKTNGLYRFSRNPQFIGYGIFILGFILAWWTPSGLIALVTYAMLAYSVARMEEEHLTRVYGQPYLNYCVRVPRFIGFPRKEIRSQDN